MLMPLPNSILPLPNRPRQGLSCIRSCFSLLLSFLTDHLFLVPPILSNDATCQFITNEQVFSYSSGNVHVKKTSRINFLNNHNQSLFWSNNSDLAYELTSTAGGTSDATSSSSLIVLLFSMSPDVF